METLPELDQYPHQTYDKLRYGDTDRQGHVNNAVFSTLIETGRCEIFYDPSNLLTSHNCTFVIASLTLDFLSEVNWPGRVEIGTRIASIGRSSVTLEQALFQDDRCAATAKAVIVQMNETTRRSHPLDERTIAYLKTLSTK